MKISTKYDRFMRIKNEFFLGHLQYIYSLINSLKKFIRKVNKKVSIKMTLTD